jgi:peptidyl-prolyl cis-trans isomerase B (cyclophilin B)
MKHIALLAVLAGFMFGCQTAQLEPKNEEVDAKPDTEQKAAEKAVEETAEKEETQPVEETAQVEEVKPVEELVKEAPVASVKEPVVEERKTVMILIKTSKGDITLELNEEKAPKTVANFLAYTESGHYNGTIFHRVMDGFMVQGGGFDADMNQKNAPNMVENEASNGLKNEIGTVAMARTPDPHSASAQFFINVGDNAFLNYPGQDGWGYCVFGKVVEGMDVVNEIKGVATGNNGHHQNVPKEPVMITEVTVID